MPADILILLIAAAFVAGYIDAVAGGGGLVTIPALLLSGMDPLAVLGTNKVQGMFGSGSATLAYAAKGHVDLATQWPGAVAAAIGSVGGALLAFAVPTGFLETALPFLLITVAVFFAVRPGLGDLDRERRVSPAFFVGFAVPLIGAYDGLFRALRTDPARPHALAIALPSGTQAWPPEPSTLLSFTARHHGDLVPGRKSGAQDARWAFRRRRARDASSRRMSLMRPRPCADA